MAVNSPTNIIQTAAWSARNNKAVSPITNQSNLT